MKDIRGSLTKYAPQIMTGLGIAGLVGAGVLAVKVTPRAKEALDYEEEKLKHPLSWRDKLCVAWKFYIPPVIVAASSSVALISSCHMQTRRTAVISGAYEGLRTTYNLYKSKVKETIAEQEVKKIETAVAEARVASDPVDSKEVILTKGDTLCYDPASGRYFKSSMDEINRVVASLNRRLRSEMTLTLNEFYEELGLSDIALGDSNGWDIDKCYLDVKYSTVLATDGTPCLALEYDTYPLPLHYYN